MQYQKIIFTQDQLDTTINFCMQYILDSDICSPGWLQEGRLVNFFVERRESLTGDEQVDWVKIPIGFIDVIPFNNSDGYFNADGSRESDWIVFMDYEDENGNPWPSWAFNLNLHPNNPRLIYSEPIPGDTAFIIVEKPFLKEDVYEFMTLSPFIDNVDARNLSLIHI